ARHDLFFLRLLVGRHQSPRRWPDLLVARVAEDAFSAGIARSDDAVQVLRDDRIIGGLDDGSEVGAGGRFVVIVVHSACPRPGTIPSAVRRGGALSANRPGASRRSAAGWPGGSRHLADRP